MISLIKKLQKIAVRLKGGVDAAVGEPYETTCTCGRQLTGMRRSSWIEAECEHCYDSVFILPANVYPSTKRVRSQVLGGSLTDRLRAVIDELRPPKKKSASTDSADGAAGPVDVPRPRRRLLPQLPTVNLKRILRRTFTPLRILMVASICVIGLTGYWLMYQRAFEAAQQTWLKSSDEIEMMLAEHRFSELEETLQQAVAAGRVLGRDDAQWRRTLNLLDEVQSFNRVSAVNLVSAFHNAYDDRNFLVESAPDAIESSMNTGAFIFDSHVTPVAEESGVYLVEFPATPGRHPVELRVTLPALSEVLGALGDSRLMFAASLSDVEAPVSRSNRPWKMTIDPQSFVLLSSDVLCQELGLLTEEDEATQQLLTDQRQFVEQSLQWAERGRMFAHSGDEPEERTTGT